MPPCGFASTIRPLPALSKRQRTVAHSTPLPLTDACNGPCDQGLARRGGAQVQGLPEARRGDQSLRAGDGSALRRGDPRGGRLPARARPQRRVARRPAAGGIRADPRGLAAQHRPAPLRRAADRRHGPPRRRDRRDAHRRGQDPDRDPAGLPQHPGRRQRPRRHRQRLPGPPRLRMDGADLRGAGRQRRRRPGLRRSRDPAAQIRRRRHLRDQLRVRLRLPARQHVAVARAVRPARPPLRDRGRGRQHPHRRGADAADHLRPARTGGPDLLHLRPPGQTAGRRPGQRETEIPRREQGHLRRRLRLRVRREAQDGRPDRARGEEHRAVHRRRQPLPGRTRRPRQPPQSRR